jgi:dUTP pyrophosphatase
MDKNMIDKLVKISIDKQVKQYFQEKKPDVIVKIKKYDETKIDYFNLRYATEGSAGMDIYSIEETSLEPGEYKAISTNIAVELPEGYEIQVRPRSGLAIKNGISVINSPGTVDSDYRGEIKVLLINHSKEVFNIKPGDRIAQLVVCKYEKAKLIQVQELSDTKRGEGGFGSTGTTFQEYMDLTSLDYLTKNIK